MLNKELSGSQAELSEVRTELNAAHENISKECVKYQQTAQQLRYELKLKNPFTDRLSLC